MANLFINACVREESRTLEIAKNIIKKMGIEVEEINLDKEKIKPLNSKRLIKREKLLNKNALSNKMFDMAKQFADAETIIIAAPYWDLSFPALLKIYLENISVLDITFSYKDDKPVGLCKAKKLIYVTTSGGEIFADFGYIYVKNLAGSLFGIKNTVCYRAENLDIDNISKNEVLKKAKIVEIK